MDSTKKTVGGGVLIVFDGIDGSGKTSQLELVKQSLESAGWLVKTTRNLGGTPIGERLRDIIKSDLERTGMANLHISLAIQEALLPEIDKMRSNGAVILMDRGPLSLAAYEMYGAELDETLVWPYVEDAMAKFHPELTLLYEIEVDTALGRARQKDTKGDYFESKRNEYHQNVAHGYAESAKMLGQYRIVMIDANRTIAEIQSETQAQVDELLARKS